MFFLSSCGLRESQTVHDNVLVGTWSLQRVSCALTATSSGEVERYDLNTIAEISLIFKGQFIDYSSVGLCTTTSIGKYKTDFDGTSQGIVEFYDVLTGSKTCTEDIVDSGANTVGSQSISTTMISKNTGSLSWVYSEESSTLELEYYADFKGSVEQVACSGSCFCTAVFTAQ